MIELPTITVRGTPRAMGLAQGEARRAGIHAFVAERLRACRVYLFERGHRDLQPLLTASRACFAAHEAWDPIGASEQRGIADGAGIDLVELYAASNMTDIRDVVLYPTSDPAREGCTSLLLPPRLARGGELIAAQTWDLNPGDLRHVLAVQRLPDTGPETWSVTCEGSLSLVGMNAAGLWVGTTNIKVADTRAGVPYTALLHRVLRERSQAAAAALVEAAPRCAAHTFWFADAGGGCMLECSAERAVRRELGQEPVVQTNHCLDDRHCRLEAEPASASSQRRLARASAVVAAGGQDVASLRSLFGDRSDGVDSISRYAEDGQGTSTNSCLIGIPARRELHACAGPADRGVWRRLMFETAG